MRRFDVRAAALAAKSLRTNDTSLRTLEINGRKIVASIDGGRLRIPPPLILPKGCTNADTERKLTSRRKEM